MNRDRYESLEYDGRLYYEIRRIESENEDLQKELKEKDKEIKRLKEDIETRKKEIDYWRIQFSNKEEIRNKAIEYIKEKARNNCWIDQYEANDLINILKGVDKECK